METTGNSLSLCLWQFDVLDQGSKVVQTLILHSSVTKNDFVHFFLKLPYRLTKLKPEEWHQLYTYLSLLWGLWVQGRNQRFNVIIWLWRYILAIPGHIPFWTYSFPVLHLLKISSFIYPERYIPILTNF